MTYSSFLACFEAIFGFDFHFRLSHFFEKLVVIIILEKEKEKLKGKVRFSEKNFRTQGLLTILDGHRRDIFRQPSSPILA